MKRYITYHYDLDNFKFEQVINYKRLFQVCLVIIVLLSMAVYYLYRQKERTHVIHTHSVSECTHKDIPLTDSAIVHELTTLGCVLPTVALAQFKIETGHFKSVICRENKNLAGIKTSRSAFVVGKNRNHCVYRTYRDCLKDYVRIQNRYLKAIDGKYAEASGYIKQIRTIK